MIYSNGYTLLYDMFRGKIVITLPNARSEFAVSHDRRYELQEKELEPLLALTETIFTGEDRNDKVD